MCKSKTKTVENNKNILVCNGVDITNTIIREEHDFYATDPTAVHELLKVENFNNNIWEIACGQGHIAEVLKNNGYTVKCSDLINRGYENTILLDFMKNQNTFNGDIITNPPYKKVQLWVEKALDTIHVGNKLAMLLKLTFLESKARKKLFEKQPPIRVHVFSSRIKCAKNGDFDKYNSSAIAYAWFVWVKGYKGDPIIKWID